jgi:uncharacterized protein YhaN
LAEAEARFALAEQRWAALEREIKALGERLERLSAWHGVQDNLARADEALANLAADRARLDGLQSQLAELQGKRQEQAAIDSLNDERLAALRRKRGLLAAAAEREQKRTATQNDSAAPRTPWRWGAPLLLAILALGALGVALLPAWRMTAAIAAAAAGAICAGVVLRAWLAAATARTVREARLADLTADRDQALAEAAAIQVGGGFDGMNWVELEDVLRRAEALADLRGQIEKVRAQIGMLPPPDELDRAAQQTRAHQEQWRRQADELRAALGETDPSPERLLDSLPARLESLEAARERAGRERDDALSLAGQCRARLDNPASWEERLADLESERAHLAVEAEALWTAVATLDEALVEFMGDDLTRLAAAAQGFFDELVGAGERRVEVDASLTPALASGETEFAFDMLSRATGDQLLLCCRLALLDHLTGERGAPLWLDDAAVGYDAGRTDRLLALLQRIAAKRQVILFTPDERVAAAAGPEADVVRLP